MRKPTSPSTNASCTIRPFESSDRDALLSLYRTVFEKERSADWFRWKYTDNPYADHVPIVVAEDDGKLVGCRAFFALEMRVGDDERIAFQPCDTMVHPAYRNQGVFSRMNEYALERYADATPSFCFNFPNENAKPGNLNHGWKEIGTVPTYYRPQNPIENVKKLSDDGDEDGTAADDDGPSGWVCRDLPHGDGDTGHPHENGNVTRRHGGEDDGSDGDTSGVTDALSDVIKSSQLAGDKLLTRASSDVAVVRFESPPAAVLETVYRRSVPDGIHTHRTAEFYRWRLDNPARSYTTYVATRDGETPLAALVCSRVDDHLRIVETLPRAIDTEREAINRVLVAALTDCSDRNYVTAFGETLPTPMRYRFYPDTRFPLSTLTRPSARTLLARDLGDSTGFEETTGDDWVLSRLDVDTS